MRAKKSLGQNFLRDEAVVERIVASLDLKFEDTVVEIGPGQGALTEFLIESGANVTAIEFDRDMVSILRAKFGLKTKFQVIQTDALGFDFAGLTAENPQLKLVANLPYNISTPILQRLIEQRHLFSVIVLMFQREVVERITAKPGGKERGFLSVLVENAFDAERLFDVPPKAFSPVPKVWSSVVRLTPKKSNIENERAFRKLISAAFAQKRKTLLNNLKQFSPDAARLLEGANIDGSRRAETLTLDEWASIQDVFAANKPA